MIGWRGILPTLVVAACSTSSPPSEPVNQGAMGKKTPRSWSCDTLVPPTLRKKWLEGSMISGASLAEQTLMCTATQSGVVLLRIAYDCRPTTTFTAWQARRDEDKAGHPAYVDQNDIGRSAYGDLSTVHFYDDDADCAVSVSTDSGRDVTLLAKDLSTVLTAAMIPARKKAHYSLDCDRLIPASLRERYLSGGRSEASSNVVDVMECATKFQDLSQTDVTYDCRHHFTKDFVAQMKLEFEKKKMSPQEVDVGLGGLYFSMLGSHSITFVDSDLGCMVNLMMTRGSKEKALELARAIDDALTPMSAR
jgi:hypothetical protein